LLRSIRNNNAFMGLTLSSIGLIIASGFILAAVFSFIYYSEFQRNAEIQNIASGFSIMVEGMDTRFFENTTLYFFPEKEYYYNVSLNSEYIIVDCDGTWWGDKLSVKERFLIRPWPRKNNSDWLSGEELHNYLDSSYNQSGNYTDPIQGTTNIDKVKNILKTEWEDAAFSLALNPFYVDSHKAVYIDKIFIYYNTDGNNGWDKNYDEKQEFILVYQKP